MQTILILGHNSDRFLQWVNGKSRIDFLIDDSLAKQGKFLANCSKMIGNNIRILSKKAVILTGVHPRSSSSIKKQIKKYGFSEVQLIFDNCYDK